MPNQILPIHTCWWARPRSNFARRPWEHFTTKKTTWSAWPANGLEGIWLVIPIKHQMPGDVSSWATKQFDCVTNLFPSNKDQMCQLSRCTIASSWSIPSYLNISKLPHQSPQLRSPAGMPPSRKAAIWASALRLHLVEVLGGLMLSWWMMAGIKSYWVRLWENCGKTCGKVKPDTFQVRFCKEFYPLGRFGSCNKVVRPPFLGDGTTLPPIVASLGSIQPSHPLHPSHLGLQRISADSGHLVLRKSELVNWWLPQVN